MLLSQVITLCVSHHVTKHGDRTLPSKYMPSTELCLWVMGLGVVCCRGPESVGSGRREEGIKSRLSYGELSSRGGAQGGVSRVRLKNVLTARGHLHGRTLKETLCCCYQSMFVVISLLGVSERFSISDCIPCYFLYSVWTMSVVSEKIFYWQTLQCVFYLRVCFRSYHLFTTMTSSGFCKYPTQEIFRTSYTNFFIGVFYIIIMITIFHKTINISCDKNNVQISLQFHVMYHFISVEANY